MRAVFYQAPALYTVLAALFVSILASLLLPITLDEAYYSLWGQRLSFGYFDHPPAVAFLSFLDSLLGFKKGRTATIALGIGSLLLAGRLFWKAGLRKPKTWILSLILFKFNLACLASGILKTPDAPLVFFWLLALHEGLAALNGKDYRWLTAGLACGLGLLSKYAMFLMGPIFLICLLKNPHNLKKPWPYLGGILAFLVFLPNLKWNAEHEWTSFAFQLRRVLPLSIHTNSNLPQAEPSPASLLELDFFEKMTAEETPEPSPPKKKTIPIPPVLSRFLEYLGSLLALWGFLVVPLFSLLQKSKRKKDTDLKNEAQTLLHAALWVPLIFFGLLSLFTKVEANWGAIYMLAASPLLAPYFVESFRSLKLASFANCALILLLAAHARMHVLPLKNDRILRETSGFSLLAKHIEKLPEPIFADTYQVVSMLRFYQTEKKILQWPNINRPSELTHNPQFSYSLEELEEKKQFSLITSDKTVPHFPGFKVSSIERASACREGNLQLLSLEKTKTKTACTPIHHWLIIRYLLAQN